MILYSFLFFLVLFVFIGVMSVIANRHTSMDYLLASHSVKPWMTALSAIATNNSGYMFVGMIGFTYTTGLASIWLMFGWIVGDFIISHLVHKKLRTTTENVHTHSFGGVLAKWQGDNMKKLRAVIGIVTVLFLGTYAAAQLQAGSKALYVLFDWDYAAGAIIGSVIVVLYCFAGGIRASIWTDVAQSFVMIIAMALMLYMSVQSLGGPASFVQALGNVSDTYMNWFPPDLSIGAPIGPFLFALGWLFAGFAIIGQPHIMVRFMAIDSPSHIKRARIYYYCWYTVFYAMTIGAGLAARLLLPETDTFDPELALPSLAIEMLPDVLVGLVLAGLFAAAMSTADSLIISTTAAVSRDFSIARLGSYWMTKATTVIVTLLALIIALYGPGSVFVLVVLAWALLGSAFGPLLIVYALGQHPTEKLGIGMVLGGSLTVILWHFTGLNAYIYEVAPGMIVGMLIFYLGKIAGHAPNKANM